MLPHRGGGAETYIDLLGAMDGVAHLRLPLAGARTALMAAPSLLAGWPRAARAFRGADVLHVHGDMAAMLCLPLLGRGPAVWTTHGLHFLRRAEGPIRGTTIAALRAVVAACEVTICTSEAERDELARLVPERRHSRLVTVRNGIAPPAALPPGTRERLRSDLELAGDDLAVLFLGQLEPRKRPLAAIEAVTAARRRGARMVLLVAGTGPLEAEIRALEGPGVRSLGHRADVSALLEAADVLVMPSEREGLSFAVLEAMGRGLALVVSDGPGNPEAVGDAGVVVPLHDVEALTEALVGLSRDPARRARLGEAARRRVAEELSAERLVRGVADAYARAARTPAQSPATK